MGEMSAEHLQRYETMVLVDVAVLCVKRTEQFAPTS